MQQDTLSVKGHVHIKVIGPDGQVKQEITKDNLIVHDGKAAIINRLQNTPTITEVTHMSVGTDSTTEVDADTTLGTEIARVALDGTNLATEVFSNDTISYVGTFPAGVGTGNLVEAGLFNDPTAGTMYSRVTFGVVTKGPEDAIQITWKYTIN
jgi:hypothetical protein